MFTKTLDRLVQTSGPSCKHTHIVHGQQADNCGVNYSFHTLNRQAYMASIKDGINEQAASIYEPGIWKLP